VADLFDAIRRDAGTPLLELRVDGGASANNALMQFQSDILGVPVARPAVTETTALGAAYLAGIAVGFWRSFEEIAEIPCPGVTFEPRIPRSKAEALRGRWNEALSRAKAWDDPKYSVPRARNQ
jgi:glycerol kinase